MFPQDALPDKGSIHERLLNLPSNPPDEWQHQRARIAHFTRHVQDTQRSSRGWIVKENRSTCERAESIGKVLAT